MTIENKDTATTTATTNATNQVGRDDRAALEILREAYAANNSTDYSVAMAEHATRATANEELRLARIQSGDASYMELLSEGFNRLGDQAQIRKDAEIQQAKVANEKMEQERQARLDAVYNSMKR